MLTFNQALIVCKARVLSINGRASRAEFWWLFLACLLVYIPLCMIAGMINPSKDIEYLQKLTTTLFLPFQFLILFASIRRGHDLNLPTWVTALLNLPILQVILLITMALKGNKGANKYGEDPLSPGFYDKYLSGEIKSDTKFWTDMNNSDSPFEQRRNNYSQTQNKYQNASEFDNNEASQANSSNTEDQEWIKFIAENYDDSNEKDTSNKRK